MGVLGRLSAVTTLVMVAAFPHRLEYVAHVLAGFGLAALGLALAESGAPGRVGDRFARFDRVGGRVPELLAPGGRAGVAMGLVVAGALVWELTLGGPLDVLDAANTVMGGLLGVAAILGARADPTVAPSGATDGASGVEGEPPGVVEVHGVVDLHGGVVDGAASIGDAADGVVVDGVVVDGPPTVSDAISDVAGEHADVVDVEPGRLAAQPDSLGLALAGLALVVAGLVLRYPVQHELKTLWWFGPWG